MKKKLSRVVRNSHFANGALQKLVTYLLDFIMVLLYKEN